MSKAISINNGDIEIGIWWLEGFRFIGIITGFGFGKYIGITFRNTYK